MIEQITEKKDPIVQVANLSFDCYQFYKFIDVLEKYADEIEFVFENREFSINFMDASRIMLCKCTKYLDKLTTIERMKFGISTNDLKAILRTRKEDKKEISITFDNSKTYIELVKTSETYKSIITRTLNLLELDLEEVPMDNLNKIKYPSKAIFPCKFLNDFFYESGLYSEIVEIEINELEGIGFSENGQIGNSKYLIENQYCSEIEGNEKGSYSYTFLTPIKPLLPILDKNSEIKLHIKNDHPIRLELYIDSLDINILIYLAPRVEEAEYDDYEDEFDEI
nr:MAG: proliferating cellular nuclear antigen [uncultured archaeon]